MRADTSDVAFRLLLALGELWEGLERAGIDPTCRGLHLNQEDLGGYTRYSAGPSSTPRIIVEWNESSRHLRVIRCKDWQGVDATISATVAAVRTEARSHGLMEVVDRVLVRACQDPLPSRRTVLSAAAISQIQVAAKRA